MRLEELGNQVLAPYFGGVHTDFQGEHIHGSFCRSGCLGTTCTTVSSGHRRVGDHAGCTAFDVGNVVHGAGHRAGHKRGQNCAHLDEATRILQNVHAIVADLAVAAAADGDVLDLRSAVAHDHHVFAAGFLPTNWPTSLGCQYSQQRFFWVAADLGAETAAHVWRDHLDQIGLDAVGFDDGVFGALGTLGAEPLVQTTVDPGGGGTAHFERGWGNSLVDESTLHHDFAVGEELVASVVGQTQHG